MTCAEYRIESDQPIAGTLWPAKGSHEYAVSDRALAITLAAKSFTKPGSDQLASDIRVVHVPTGEVVFTKPATQRFEWSEEL
ncbi:MAG TPA: hypothetical protein VHA82_08765 [Ramlibacter sp.]|uniref:hypothetical protein n=1 Tax=Ramlibacter sp. TaxID=1917967 RepID=UPI002CDDCE65|nr:hypothetical protein [Ramlibacter sp.]HVZ43887.1 hypothetical protein [Ramlibacter sp.]